MILLKSKITRLPKEPELGQYSLLEDVVEDSKVEHQSDEDEDLVR